MDEQDDFDNMVSREWEKLAKGEGVCEFCKEHGEVARFLYLEICLSCFLEYHERGHEVFMRSGGGDWDLSYDRETLNDMTRYVPPDVDWTYKDEYPPEGCDLPDDETWYKRWEK